MNFIKILFLGLFLILIGGFGYFALTDVNIPQKEVTQTLTLSELPE